MVEEYYKLREQPFGVTPDSRFLFLSPTHREALASLLFGVDSGCGFLVMIARPGLGKTTVLFHLMHQLREKALTVFLFQTVCTPMDLLRALLAGLGVEDTQGSLVQLQSRLKQVLVEQANLGKRVVVVIDEAQNLDDSVLELIRMLSNFETQREKLIQIILSGQPQLADKIGSPDLEQLRQRVSIFAGLDPFSREETRLYIEHRLKTAGYAFDMPLFTRDALSLIADASVGVPRNINNLCFNSLALGCALQRRPIDTELVREVIGDLDLGRWKKKSATPTRLEEKTPEAVPAFLSSAAQPSMFAGWFAGWLGKAAIVLLVIILLGGGLFVGRQWLAHKPPMNTESVPGPLAVPAPALVPTRPPSPAAEVARLDGKSGASPSANQVIPPLGNPSLPSDPQPLPPAASAGMVSVGPGKTLFGICEEKFGKCNPELLREIRKLNPRLQLNPDHIESGEMIRLPVPGTTLEQPAKPSLADGKTP